MAIEKLDVIEDVVIALRGPWRERRFAGAMATRVRVVLDGDEEIAPPTALDAAPLTTEELAQLDGLISTEALAQHSQISSDNAALTAAVAKRNARIVELEASVAQLTAALDLAQGQLTAALANAGGAEEITDLTRQLRRTERDLERSGELRGLDQVRIEQLEAELAQAQAREVELGGALALAMQNVTSSASESQGAA